jgi:hypothetical protein
MQDDWTEKLSCAIQCHRCDEKMDPKDPSFLSMIIKPYAWHAKKKKNNGRTTKKFPKIP